MNLIEFNLLVFKHLFLLTVFFFGSQETGILNQTLTSIDVSSLKTGVYYLKSGVEVMSFIIE